MSTMMPRRSGSARVLPMIAHPDFEQDQVNALVAKMQEHVGESKSPPPFFVNPDTSMRVVSEAISEMKGRGWTVELIKMGTPRPEVHFS